MTQGPRLTQGQLMFGQDIDLFDELYAVVRKLKALLNSVADKRRRPFTTGGTPAMRPSPQLHERGWDDGHGS